MSNATIVLCTAPQHFAGRPVSPEGAAMRESRAFLAGIAAWRDAVTESLSAAGIAGGRVTSEPTDGAWAPSGWASQLPGVGVANVAIKGELEAAELRSLRAAAAAGDEAMLAVLRQAGL
jgi:hypothetical protein